MVTQLHVTIIVIAFYSLFVDVEKNRKENGLKDRWNQKKNPTYVTETRPSFCVCFPSNSKVLKPCLVVINHKFHQNY